MKFPVIVHTRAVADAENIHAFLHDRDPDFANRWTNDLDDMLGKLSEFPNRYALAPESRGSTYPVRHVLVGKYRVLYAVRGSEVHILRICHAAQQPFKPSDLN